MANAIMEVQALYRSGTVSRLDPRVTKLPTAETPVPAGDRVEISATATWLDKYHSQPEVRADLVAKIRSQIKAGTYETPEKWDRAIDSLMDDLSE